MEKVKVLMIGNSLSVRGGITSVIDQLLSFDWEKNNVKVRFVPTYIDSGKAIKSLFYLIAYFKIIFIFLFDCPDILHIHMSYKGSFYRKLYIQNLAKVFKVPNIIHLHGSEFEKWYYESSEETQIKIRKLLINSDSFIVLGNKWNDIIKRIEPNTNTLVVSNAVKIPSETAKWNFVSFQVVFLGVLIKRKGVADLLQAISIIKKNNNVGNLRFVIAGTGEDELELKELAVSLDISECVDFIGWIDGIEKKELLKDSQLMVLPSYNEGLPIAILEALSYGLPIIASDVGDISSAVIDGKNGFLIEAGNYEKLASSIVKIAMDQTMFEKQSIVSRKLATSNFSDDKYQDLLGLCYHKFGGIN